MIREDILRKFPELFGTKRVNGREVNVEQTIAALTRDFEPEIAAALTARRALLNSPEPVGQKICLAKVGRRVSRSRYGPVLDLSSDRAGLDR